MPILLGILGNWRVILAFVIILGITGVSTYIWYLKHQLESARADAALSQALYEQNIQQFEILKAERLQEQKLLQQREQRLKADHLKAERRLREILEHDASQDCPVSDSINNLLNGLSGPESQDTDTENPPAN